MKRKQSDVEEQQSVDTPASRRSTRARATATPTASADTAAVPTESARGKGADIAGTPITPSRKRNASQKEHVATPASTSKSRQQPATPVVKDSAACTPRQLKKNKVLFVNAEGNTASSPSVIRNADRSAKRKSVRALVEPTDDDVWDGGDKLAQEIWEEAMEDDNGERDGDDEAVDTMQTTSLAPNENMPPQLGDVDITTTTPAKRKERLRAPRSRRSPTPEGNLPPHERYFFQNRPGPVQTSNNTLRGMNLLTHEEYFDLTGKHVDNHEEGRKFLFELHERSYAQWDFELSENFSVCLYGYGSKRTLVRKFATWLYQRDTFKPPSIVIVNGYRLGTSIRGIFATIVEAIYGAENMPSKLGTQPSEVLEVIRAAMQDPALRKPITVMINSVDAPPLRRSVHQSLLARLAHIPSIRLLVTADTPNFPLLWDVSLREQFNFVYHDCTTFEPFTEEVNVVDEVNSLLGRKTRRVGGKDGIGFVLKSLPENTRKLYRLILTEILTLIGEQQGLSDEEEGEPGAARRNQIMGEEDKAFVSWRVMYIKAMEEFISSSEMMFRTQLKEFIDHQMVISKTDASGLETLGVPLSREEMEAVLEESMMD